MIYRKPKHYYARRKNKHTGIYSKNYLLEPYFESNTKNLLLKEVTKIRDSLGWLSIITLLILLLK